MVALPQLPQPPEPQLKGHPKIATHLKHGGESLSRGRLEEALYEYELARQAEASLKNPDVKAHILWCIGAALYMLERSEEALTYFAKALELVPHDWQLHSARGLVLNSLGRLQEAVDAFDQSLALHHNETTVEARRAVLDALLRRLARRGVISGSGPKPKGLDPLVKLTPGPDVSDYVIEDRR